MILLLLLFILTSFNKGKNESVFLLFVAIKGAKIVCCHKTFCMFLLIRSWLFSKDDSIILLDGVVGETWSTCLLTGGWIFSGQHLWIPEAEKTRHCLSLWPQEKRVLGLLCSPSMKRSAVDGAIRQRGLWARRFRQLSGFQLHWVGSFQTEKRRWAERVEFKPPGFIPDISLSVVLVYREPVCLYDGRGSGYQRRRVPDLRPHSLCRTQSDPKFRTNPNQKCSCLCLAPVQ